MSIDAGSDTKLEKAYLVVQPPSGAGQTITFQFNPTDYRVSKASSWVRTTSRSGAQAGPLQWRGAGPRRMSVTMFLDDSDAGSGSVNQNVEALLACCAPTPASVQSGQPRAPYVQFGWGSVTSFTAVVRSVEASYTLFRPTGEPCRALVELELEEVDVPTARQNPTSGGTSVPRSHTVVAGDRLALIAYHAYGDPGQWRLIATANNIDNPLALRVGTTLLLPAVAQEGGAT